MASESETVMAVCAEWRACIEAADPSVWNDERIAGLVATTKAQQLAYLDRIEAAAKREKAEIEANALAVGRIVEAAYKRETAEIEAAALAVGGVVDVSRNTPGNAAALREALVEIRDTINKWYDDDYISHGAFSVLWDLCSDALAAHARNCDLPLVVDGPADNNADKAWLVFKRHNPDAYFDVSGLLRCIDWLLATAERKGDGNGR